MSEVSLKEIVDLRQRLAAGIAYVEVEAPDGTLGIGSAFHVGDGIFITARHVVERKKIISVSSTESSSEKQDEESNTYRVTHFSGVGKVEGDPYYHPDEKCDIAALKVTGIKPPIVPILLEFDDFVSSSSYCLMPVMILGFPPIPFSDSPILIASRGEVCAVVDKYTGGPPHYLISAMPRGGFSGGPALSVFGYAIGVVTEALTKNGEQAELGFMAVVTSESIVTCLVHHKIVPKDLLADLTEIGWPSLDE